LDDNYFHVIRSETIALFVRYGANDPEQIIDILSALFDIEFINEETVREDPDLMEMLGFNDYDEN